ncbi:MAG: DUF192 domain-containing protein [Chloroflexi bacterium]|nr:DUF192 domain-containing protein [Chloroflexota bacterium]
MLQRSASLLLLPLLGFALGCGSSAATPTPFPISTTITRLPTATPFPLPAPTSTSSPTVTTTSLPPTPRVALEGVTFTVELATTPEERARGLMGRERLGDTQGMLFIYQTDVTPGFWMRGMLISLDIVWIDADGVVAGIQREVPPALSTTDPPLYYPPRPIRYVLEISAGSAGELGIEPGSQATLLSIP